MTRDQNYGNCAILGNLGAWWCCFGVPFETPPKRATPKRDTWSLHDPLKMVGNSPKYRSGSIFKGSWRLQPGSSLCSMSWTAWEGFQLHNELPTRGALRVRTRS